MSKAYIIANNKLIAQIDTELKNGTLVQFSNKKVKEAINANYEWNLVNAASGKISRAKKWEKEYILNFGEELNEGYKEEFYIV